MGHLISLMVKNRNKFTVHSFDLVHPEGVSKHNVGFSIFNRSEMIRLLDRSMQVPYLPESD